MPGYLTGVGITVCLTGIGATGAVGAPSPGDAAASKEYQSTVPPTYSSARSTTSPVERLACRAKPYSSRCGSQETPTGAATYASAQVSHALRASRSLARWGSVVAA